MRALKTVSAVAFSFVCALYAYTAAAGPGKGPQLDVELVVDGLVAPLDLTFAPDSSGRRFIVDQTGLVLILTPDDEVLRPTVVSGFSGSCSVEANLVRHLDSGPPKSYVPYLFRIIF